MTSGMTDPSHRPIEIELKKRKTKKKTSQITTTRDCLHPPTPSPFPTPPQPPPSTTSSPHHSPVQKHQLPFSHEISSCGKKPCFLQVLNMGGGGGGGCKKPPADYITRMRIRRLLDGMQERGGWWDGGIVGLWMVDGVDVCV